MMDPSAQQYLASDSLSCRFSLWDIASFNIICELYQGIDNFKLFIPSTNICLSTVCQVFASSSKQPTPNPCPWGL